MDDKLAEALELDAAAVEGAPLLGHRIVEVAEPGDSSSSRVARELRVSQPWIETENDPITIDIELFAVCRPLYRLLIKGPEASGFIASLSEALTDFGARWAISSQLRDRACSSAGVALVVDGGDTAALVWRAGMVIGTYEPLATTLKLLTADFSEEARRTHVYARPQLLKSALSLLPGDLKSLYVPRANDFIQQATREQEEQIARKREWLKAKAAKKPTLKIGPDGVILIRPGKVPPPDPQAADND
jgi:hypothetical protein